MPKGIYIRTKKHRLDLRNRFLGDKNPAKREDVRLKISKGNKGKSHAHKYNAECNCFICKKIRKEPVVHKNDCACMACKLKRGEFRHTSAEKKRISQRFKKYHKENPDFNKGKNNSAWKGGKSSELYGVGFNKELKLFIRQRDNYTCQYCGLIENGRNHATHHIDYNKQNNNLLNLITLCRSCYSKTQFGGRDKWQFLFEILQEIRFFKLSTTFQNV